MRRPATAVRRFTAQGLDEINDLAFSPDGKTVIAGGYTSASTETFAPIWDVETGREILRLHSHLSFSQYPFHRMAKRFSQAISKGFPFYSMRRLERRFMNSLESWGAFRQTVNLQ